MSLGEAVAIAVDRIAAPVEGMHRVISGRWFSLLRPIAAPVEVVHDAVRTKVYGSIRGGGALVGLGLDQWIDPASRTADVAQAITSGLWGDTLGPRRASAPAMSIRDCDGVAVTPGPGLAAAFPAATNRLVLLVHGLVDTEHCWAGTDTHAGLATVLHDHPELTPIAIRYNTGLHISDNGQALADVLAALHDEWPIGIESIALVGHSMGGLVIRSACETALADGHPWIDKVDDVVTIASPHRGAWLEKAANVAAWGLGVAPQTRPLAAFLNGRSAGIKDLRFGAIARSDWQDIDPDAVLVNTVGIRPLPAGIRHHFVGSVLTSNPRHPLGVVMGDFMIRTASSTARDLEPTSMVVHTGTHHFNTPHDPVVVDQVMAWLDPPSAGIEHHAFKQADAMVLMGET